MRKKFGENVRYLRSARRVTQTEVAKQCGIFRTYLSRIESGEANPSLTVIVALADALEVLPHELLYTDGRTQERQHFFLDATLLQAP